MQYDLYIDNNGEWRWILLKGGEIIVRSEKAFSSINDCIDSVNLVKISFDAKTIIRDSDPASRAAVALKENAFPSFITQGKQSGFIGEEKELA